MVFAILGEHKILYKYCFKHLRTSDKDRVKSHIGKGISQYTDYLGIGTVIISSAIKWNLTFSIFYMLM